MTRARNSANLASQGNLFVDIANDRTGIGSVVPAQNLHVAGTAGFHADTTFTGDLYNATWDRSDNSLKFVDNAKIKIGTGGDLNLYHASDNSYVDHTGTGHLFIRGNGTNGVLIRPKAGENSIVALSDAEVQLWHNNLKKFETTAYGTNTTGTAVNDGLVVAGVATVTTMNVTGVLTYDDVTSVDSVGIVTARQGIHIDDSIVHISDTNTKIRFPANDTISFETGGGERIRIDSIGRLLHGTTSSLIQDYRYRAQIQRTGSNALDSGILGLYFTGSSGASAQNVATAIGFYKKESDGNALANNGGIGILRFNGFDGSNYVEAATIGVEVDGNAGTNDMPGRIEFSTTADGASSPTERLRIDSEGRLLLGTTTEGHADADDFTIGTSTNDAGITIRTNTSGTGRLFFSDGTSGTAEYQGYLQYDHSKGLLSLGSGGSTRVNITDVGIGTFIEPGTGNGMGGVVASTANAGGNAGFRWMTNSVGRYQVTTIGSAGAESLRVYDMNNSAERIRITGIGSVGVGINAPIAQFQVNSTKNAETGRGDARNYHLALRNPADDTGEAIGLSFGITSNAEKVGAAILHERDGGGSQGSLQFYTSSDGNSLTERMRVQANGRVNIGVNANVGAQSLLNLKGSGDDGNQTVLLRLGNDSSGSGTGAAMVMGAGAGASSQGVTLAGFYDGTGTTFTLGTNASFNGSTTERFRITKDGYLGLGAGSNTNKPLHIYTGSSDSEIRLQTNSGTEQNSYISLRQSNGDLDFYTVNAASMKFHTTNTERVKIHAAGYFTKAYQPFFSVYGSASNVTYNDGDEIDFENAIHNDGSHFKMTSGTGQYKRFIAPVAGIYIFTFGFFPNTASGCRISLAVNGSVQTNPYISGCFSNWGTGQPAPMATQMLKLSASDYVTVKIQSGTLTNTYDGHTGFQGYLLG